MASLAEILRFGSKFNIFCGKKEKKNILFAYLIIAFGLCQKTQSSAKYQKNPKSINVFVKCQNLEQHVARNNINLMVVVRNFLLRKINTIWIIQSDVAFLYSCNCVFTRSMGNF